MRPNRVKAPEIRATDWLNVSAPLSLDNLRGKIVLLDFWTFCCVDCMHILPYLKSLEAKYADVLVVIGVHSAKFPNEKDSSQIRKAIARYGIQHPVANDARFDVWEDFWVREWPTLVLIDPDGFIAENIPCSKQPYGKLDADIESLIEEFDASGKLDRSTPSFQSGQGADPGVVSSESSSSDLLLYPGKITADDHFLYISDTGHNRIIVSDFHGAIQDTIGTGQRGHADGDYSQATFNSPQGLCIHESSLYVADTENHLLRRIDLTAKTVTTVAGTGRQSLLSESHFPKAPSPALETELSSPWDLISLNNQLYVCMAGPHQIWYYDPATATVGNYAGNAIESLLDGPLLESKLAQPSGITTDGQDLYFVDAETSAIRFASAASAENPTSITSTESAGTPTSITSTESAGNPTSITSTESAGNPTSITSKESAGNTTSITSTVSAGNPTSITSTLSGGNPNRITSKAGATRSNSGASEDQTLQVSGVTRSVKTLVGEGLFEFGDVDGPLAKARLQHPLGISWSQGRLYVCDSYNHKIKVVDIDGNEIRTLAGGAGPGFEDGDRAHFAEPGGLVYARGQLFIADTNNNVIRVVNPQSGLTHTLDLGRPAASLTTQRFPNLTVTKLSALSVTAGQPLTVELRVDLPSEFHLNDDAPMVAAGRCDLLQKFHSAKGSAENGAKSPIHLNFVATAPGKTELEALLQVYYCSEGENSACRVASFIWTCPLIVTTAEAQMPRATLRCSASIAPSEQNSTVPQSSSFS